MNPYSAALLAAAGLSFQQLLQATEWQQLPPLLHPIPKHSWHLFVASCLAGGRQQVLEPAAYYGLPGAPAASAGACMPELSDQDGYLAGVELPQQDPYGQYGEQCDGQGGPYDGPYDGEYGGQYTGLGRQYAGHYGEQYDTGGGAQPAASAVQGGRWQQSVLAPLNGNSAARHSDERRRHRAGQQAPSGEGQPGLLERRGGDDQVRAGRTLHGGDCGAGSAGQELQGRDRKARTAWLGTCWVGNSWSALLWCAELAAADPALLPLPQALVQGLQFMGQHHMGVDPGAYGQPAEPAYMWQQGQGHPPQHAQQQQQWMPQQRQQQQQWVSQQRQQQWAAQQQPQAPLHSAADWAPAGVLPGGTSQHGAGPMWQVAYPGGELGSGSQPLDEFGVPLNPIPESEPPLPAPPSQRCAQGCYAAWVGQLRLGEVHWEHSGAASRQRGTAGEVLQAREAKPGCRRWACRRGELPGRHPQHQPLHARAHRACAAAGRRRVAAPGDA